MKREVLKWYFNKIIFALEHSEIRWELHPKARSGGQKKPEVCQGWSQQRHGRKWLIVVRYRPSSINSIYVLIHEALHVAFPEWPERYCWGEPVDLVAQRLLYEFSDRQLDTIKSYLPRR